MITDIYNVSVENLVEKDRRELAWKEFVAANAGALEPIADIVQLDVLWDWIGSSSTLRLRYRGKARNATQAQGDIARIMDTLNISKLEHYVTGGGDTPYRLYLAGHCMLDSRELRIEIAVPWLPEGCQTRVTRRRTWSTRCVHEMSCSQ